MVKVSIIVPVYNAEKTICNCVNSLTNQTYKNLEIIIINDGSKDKTEDKIEKLLEKDKRLVYKYQKNLGVSVARNNGIKLAKGEWIAFCDSDDYVEAEWIESMLEKAESTKADWIICGFKKKIKENQYILDNLLKYENITLEEFAKSWYRNLYISGVCCSLYKRKLIEENKIKFPNHINHGEDTIFNMRYFSYCNKISVVEKAMYVYVSQENSLTKVYKKDIWENQKELTESFFSMLKIKGYSNKIGDFFVLRGVTLSLNHLISNYSDLKFWKQICKKIINDKRYIEITTSTKDMDKFTKIVYLLLKKNFFITLYLFFKFKFYFYRYFRKIYYYLRSE